MNPKQLNNLSKCDLGELLTLSYRSLNCRNPCDLKSLIVQLKELIYFEYAVCAQGNVIELLQSGAQAPDIDVCDISYPAGYLDLYFKNRFYYTDAVFCEFITNLEPVSWLDVDRKCGYNYPASVMALDFNMKDGWTHGTINPITMDCSVFFLCGPTADNDLRTKYILEYIIPFYSEAYHRILGNQINPETPLSSRETEVLHWVKEGKTSWEISMILTCSKRTIDFHIKNIKQKLNVVSRAQAVATGLQYGFIQI